MKAINSIPEQGNLSDIAGKTNVYIFSKDIKARDKIAKELEKTKSFKVVDKVEDSDFFIRFESWTYIVEYNGTGVGLLTVFMPSTDSNRLRFIYSVKKTEKFGWDDAAKSSIKQFLKGLLV